MRVGLYLIFRAGSRFSLGSRVPRLGCVGPVVPGGLGVLVVCCPARRVRDYPGGSGPPGGSGTSWGPGSTRQAISTQLSAGPGAGGAPGPQGRAGAGRTGGFRGREPGGRFAGRGRAQATRPRSGSWGLWFQADRTYPGYLAGALAPSTGACAPQAADRRAWPAGPAARGHTVRLASITRRRAELAGWWWDLSKTALSGRGPRSLVRYLAGCEPAVGGGRPLQ